MQTEGADRDQALRTAAIRLAGVWKLGPLGDPPRSIVLSNDAAETVRAAAIDALAEIGGKRGRASIDELTRADHLLEIRTPAVAGLARLDSYFGDVGRSRRPARRRQGQPQEIESMLAALLNRRDGAEQLAGAVARTKLPADAAKPALRSIRLHMTMLNLLSALDLKHVSQRGFGGLR